MRSHLLRQNKFYVIDSRSQIKIQNMGRIFHFTNVEISEWKMLLTPSRDQDYKAFFAFDESVLNFKKIFCTISNFQLDQFALDLFKQVLGSNVYVQTHLGSASVHT